MKRQKVSKSRSKRIFRQTASAPHPKNTAPMPMRGGIRLAIAVVVMLVSMTGCKFAMQGFTSAIESVNGEVGK